MSRGKSLAYKPGAGAERDYWSIKQWLDERRITVVSISRTLGVNVANVSATIRGLRNNREVLKWLADNECPTKILSLPDDIKNIKRNQG